MPASVRTHVPFLRPHLLDLSSVLKSGSFFDFMSLFCFFLENSCRSLFLVLSLLTRDLAIKLSNYTVVCLIKKPRRVLRWPEPHLAGEEVNVKTELIAFPLHPRASLKKTMG